MSGAAWFVDCLFKTVKYDWMISYTCINQQCGIVNFHLNLSCFSRVLHRNARCPIIVLFRAGIAGLCILQTSPLLSFLLWTADGHRKSAIQIFKRNAPWFNHPLRKTSA